MFNNKVNGSCDRSVQNKDLDIFLKDIPLTLEEAFQKSGFSNNSSIVSSIKPISITNIDSIENSKFYETRISDDEKFTGFRNSQSYKRSLSSHGLHKTKESHDDKRNSLSSINVSISKSYEKRKSLQKIKYRKSAVVKMKYVLTAMLHENRFLLLESRHYTPLILYSIQPFKKEETKISYENRLSMEISPELCKFDQSSITQNKDEVVSYKFLLKPSNLNSAPEINLENAEWTAGKHRTVLNFEGYMTSVIVYTKPAELKRDLNSKFKDTFPNVEITLSKLRSLERQIQQIAKIHSLTHGVFFFAKSYFERLVFGRVVNKFNRHHVAALCFLLAAKIHGDLKPGEIVQLISSLEHSFKTFNLLQYEFTVFAALKFSLIRIIPSDNTRRFV